MTGPIDSTRLRSKEATVRVAVVSGEQTTRHTLRQQLGRHGFTVEGFSDGVQAMGAFARTMPDVAIVDLAMREADSDSLVNSLRRHWTFPILALAARSDEGEEVSTIREGADDYLPRPLSIRALSTRIHASLRQRALVRAELGAADDGTEMIEAGPLTMDATRRSVAWCGTAISISETEFLVLSALAKRPGIVKTREQLMTVAHDALADVTDRTIDSHIKRLRKKLRAADPGFCAIETLYGVGYRFVAPTLS